MATRFYTPSSGTAAVDPTPAAVWATNIGSRVLTPAPRTKSGTAKTFVPVITATTAPESVLIWAGVSDPLAAQTVTGNWTAAMSCYESSLALNASLQLVVRVVSSDGLTVRGTVYAGHSTATNATVGALGEEFSNVNDYIRIIPSQAGSSVTAQAGDLLVIEMGYRADNTLNTAMQAEFDLGDNQGSDYALTSGVLASARTSDTWVETDQTLTFAGGGPASIALRAAGTSTAVAATATTLNPAVPTGTTTGDLSVLFVEAKPYNTAITTPSGWTKIGETTSGVVANGTDVGSTIIACYVKESATPGAIGAITMALANTACAVIHSYSKDSTYSWDYTSFTTGAQATSAAQFAATGAAGIAVAAGDWVIAGAGINTDLAVGGPSAQTIGGMAGATITNTVRTAGTSDGQGLVTTGNDSRLMVVDANVTAGSSASAPTFTFTLTSASAGSVIWLRMRQVAPPTAYPFELLIPNPRYN
jgi:hypothetical protein